MALVERQNDLRIGSRPKRIVFQGIPDRPISVELPIEYHCRLPIGLKHWLMAGREIHDAEASMRQSAMIEVTNALVVRSAVSKRADHRFNGVRISLRAG